MKSLFLLLLGLWICGQRAYVVHISMGHAGENLTRRPISVSLMRPFVIIEAQPRADPTPRFRRRPVALQEDLFIFQAPPEPLDEDVVQIPPLAIHADPYRLGFQSSQKICAGELH